MNKTTIVETLICLVIGLLIALVFYIAAVREEANQTKYAYRNCPWSCSAPHRANFHACPAYLV
jgi:hypothetical protein